jgi:hypothetical protein
MRLRAAVRQIQKNGSGLTGVPKSGPCDAGSVGDNVAYHVQQGNARGLGAEGRSKQGQIFLVELESCHSVMGA